MHVRVRAAAVLAGMLFVAGCDPTRSPLSPTASSMLMDGQYYLQLRVFGDEGCALREVTVTGPFLPTPEPLTCTGNVWMESRFIALGATHPAPDEYVYSFLIVGPQNTKTLTAAIPCYLEQGAVPYSPMANEVVTNPVTLRWTPLGGSRWEYMVYSAAPRVTVVDGGSAQVTLPGGTQTWFVDVIRVGGHEPGSRSSCSARTSGASFMVAVP